MDNQQPHQPQLSVQQQPPQSKRLEELNLARWILLIVGFIIIGFSVFRLANVENEMKDFINAKGPQSVASRIDFNRYKTQIVGQVRLIYFAHIVAGCVMVLCGTFVFKMPVPATLTGLILYLAVQGYSAINFPESLRSGIILKVLIIAGLAKAVHTAFVYSKEKNLSDMQPVGQPPGAGGTQ